ncbi:hypothetical protein PG988_012834 [Apiospora saccharicola]
MAKDDTKAKKAGNNTTSNAQDIATGPTDSVYTVPTFDAILKSRPITFVVGANKTEFTAHAGVLTRVSDPIEVLLDGHMKEAKEGRVTWDDVDDETFVRFIQWAYTEDYSTAEPDILLDASNIQIGASAGSSTSKPQQAEKPLHSVQDRSVDTASQTTQGGVRSGDMAKQFTTSTDYALAYIDFEPRINSEGCEDYTKVFFCHASLYIIADKYDITPLSELSMHKLYATLKAFKLYSSRVSNILSLAELVFENTCDGDKMRTMIVHYCACIVEDLTKCEKFHLTLQAYPDFSSALITKMTERLD